MKNLDFHPQLLDSIEIFLHKLDEVATYETKEEIELLKKEIVELTEQWESE
jgi:HAMP domain-containing protein|tara:strand:+ start:43 stop:195 length:153 start_codon:yes stop_codon:yes gene_type:complete